MIYTPKVGDRVKWLGYGYGSYTVTAVGKQCALVVDDGGTEFVATITNLTHIPETVTIEIPREVAEFVAKYWRGVRMNSEHLAIGDACRAVLSGEETR